MISAELKKYAEQVNNGYYKLKISKLSSMLKTPESSVARASFAEGEATFWLCFYGRQEPFRMFATDTVFRDIFNICRDPGIRRARQMHRAPH